MPIFDRRQCAPQCPGGIVDGETGHNRIPKYLAAGSQCTARRLQGSAILNPTYSSQQFRRRAAIGRAPIHGTMSRSKSLETRFLCPSTQVLEYLSNHSRATGSKALAQRLPNTSLNSLNIRYAFRIGRVGHYCPQLEKIATWLISISSWLIRLSRIQFKHLRLISLVLTTCVCDLWSR